MAPIPSVADSEGRLLIDFPIIYLGKVEEFKGKRFRVTAVGGLEKITLIVTPEQLLTPEDSVPLQIREEISEMLVKDYGYRNANIVYPSPWDLN